MRRALIFVLIFVLFCLIFQVALKAESIYEYNRNRILLINDIENLEVVKYNNINITGDYLIGYNGIQSTFNIIYLDENLTLLNKEKGEYASYSYYLENNYEDTLKFIGELFDESIVDYLDLRNEQNINTNISEKQEKIYMDTLETINKIDKSIRTSENYYSVDYNEQWLRVFDSFDIDTGSLVSKDIIEENKEILKEDKLYKYKFLSTFFKVYIPYIECSADYCQYREDNIAEIEEMFNKDLKMKIEYQGIDFENYTKIDNQIDENEINLLKEQNLDQIANSNTKDEIDQEVDSDEDGMVDSVDPYPQDATNQSFKEE